ncbi:MAG: hypothetical protein ACNA7Z_04245 [Dethiobacteria bacterium]
MSELYRLVNSQGGKATAIVGMTKNVGKTVTLNSLVKDYEKSDIAIGLVSAGYDGERFDRLTLKEKPRIYAPREAYVATARACFDAADADLELIEVSPFSTPLGQVCLARVKRAGLVELAGPGSVSSLKSLIEKMLSFGAEHVLVDGAINRLASASPLVTDATILASGASLGPTMVDVIKKTVFRRALFITSPLQDEVMLKAARKGLEEGNAVLLHREGNAFRVESVTGMIPLLAGAQMIDMCNEETAALVFGGALVDNTLQDVMDLYEKPPVVIVNDPTRLFITPEIYYRFLNKGGQISVLEKLNLMAVTLNPTDPCGRGYDPQMFLDKMADAIRPCPVFDLVYQEEKVF